MALDIILFDMDGTIVQYQNSPYQSSWDALGEAIGKKEEWDRLLQYYVHRPHQYQDWFEANCRDLHSLRVEEVREKLLPIPYTPGFLELCTRLQEKKIKRGIVSNGIDLITREIQREAGLDIVLANELHTADGYFTGTGTMHVHIAEKGTAVKRVLQQQEVSRERAAYFGDHFNDIPAWQEVALPLGMNLKDERCYAQVKAYFSDFRQAQEYLEREQLI
jgi:HAD superfamily phosphoserine phosphatase-like hydrolase